MSTFPGVMNEFPAFSVDRFDDQNLKSKIFFLSHCHMDHMIGLNNCDGLPGPLYLSAISSVIIRQQYPHINDLVVLTENEPTPIKYTDFHGHTKFVVVTSLAAYHCPGSVMFLFEEKNMRVLYTGDFRLSKRYMLKLKPLQNLVGSIETVYVDSTFFSNDYHNFPGQIHSAITVCDIIKEWLSKSTKNVVSLKMPARYGYELLYIQIGKRLNVKIHINDDEMRKYKYIPELDNIFTSNVLKSRIHACFDYENKNGKLLKCNRSIDPALIRVVKPTAMMWKKWGEALEIVRKETNELVRVCYSNHSSMAEITDFLNYLRPKNVQLNVVPADPFRKKEMLDALSQIMAKIHYTNGRYDAIHLSNWDNLSKLSKLNFNFSTKPKDAKEQLLLCPPKRKKK